ncbi:MAG TPA: acetoacetate--CoA ligase [Candidatus Nanopelagicales bacterium]|nr:acetoacetate--CoA ligase [Candidatus Nanopelagicales bacterium]
MLEALWFPGSDRGAAMRRWLAAAGVDNYHDAHLRSIEDPSSWWSWAWNDCGIVGSQGDVVIDGSAVGSARFFPDAQLNVVDTLLTGPTGEAGDEVLVGVDESGSRRSWTRNRLREEVAAVAEAMRAAGVEPGDRVAAWTPNVPKTLIWALGALSIGAVVSTASTDFAAQGVLDRFGQIEPVLLLVAGEYVYGGRNFDLRGEVTVALTELPSVRQVVVLGEPSADWATSALSWEAWLTPSRGAELVTTALPFDHPGFILFSSGTTGAPKCIVHSAAGVLLKDLAEQRVHLDIRAGDRVCYFTTCGWMMWNWLVMALGTGATVVLYDGQPMYPDPDRLLQLVVDEGLTFLGVSAKYIESLRESGISRHEGAMPSLRTIASTGSPLAAELFAYVYESIDPSVHLASISGGTDICGCFVLGVPTEPIYAGQIQGPALGMDIQVFDDNGHPCPTGERGELVCTTPFPSRPLGFWGDDGRRFRDSYFERFPGVWAHGDFIARTDEGGFVIHGRSDATLNSQGVRIGTAEIYRIVDALDFISESIVVGQRQGLDTRIVLFVVTRLGAELTDEMRSEIARALRQQASPRHVPAKIVQVPAIPRTVTGKLAELAVTDIVNGDPVRNTSGLTNPRDLEPFHQWAKG